MFILYDIAFNQFKTFFKIREFYYSFYYYYIILLLTFTQCWIFFYLICYSQALKINTCKSVVMLCYHQILDSIPFFLACFFLISTGLAFHFLTDQLYVIDLSSFTSVWVKKYYLGIILAMFSQKRCMSSEQYYSIVKHL